MQQRILVKSKGRRLVKATNALSTVGYMVDWWSDCFRLGTKLRTSSPTSCTGREGPEARGVTSREVRRDPIRRVIGRLAACISGEIRHAVKFSPTLVLFRPPASFVSVRPYGLDMLHNIRYGGKRECINIEVVFLCGTPQPRFHNSHYHEPSKNLCF